MGVDRFDVIQANAFIGGQLPMLKQGRNAITSGGGGIWYFVNANHANAADGNPGTSPDLPLLTISRALTLAVAGDGVCIMDGTYTHTTTTTLSTDHITICGPPGHRPETTPVSVYCSGANTWTITGSDITVMGIKTYSADTYSTFYISGSRNQVIGCYIPGPGDYGVRIIQGSYNYVADCVIEEQDLKGVEISSGGYNTIADCNIYTRSAHVMKHGLCVRGNLGTYNRVLRNIVWATDQKMSGGIVASASATYNLFVGNHVAMTSSAAANKHLRNLGGATNKWIANTRGELTLQMSAAATEAGPFTKPVTS